MKVPFLDLKTQYNTIKDEVDDAIHSVIDHTAFIGGKTVIDFEKKFAKFIGTSHCVGVGNGTDAIFLALKALNIGEGDEVITVANTFVATSEAITATGANVVFADCHESYYTVDVNNLEGKITSKTKAVVVVHLYGQSADMDKIFEIAKKYDLFIIEDCAQAHGAKYKGRTVGTFGDAATFSFYPGKNLGAYGDAGAIATNNENIAQKCRMLANHGRIDKYNHEIEGFNSRLDSIQAAILSVKLKYINQWNEERRRVANIYSKELRELNDIKIPVVIPESVCVYHLYVIRTNEREELNSFLNSKNISTGIHYPIGLPYLQAYQYLNHKPEDFPITFKYQDEILSLPIYPELTDENCMYVIEKIKEFYK